jgi:O-antigen/teichoic acid export membrane protein
MPILAYVGLVDFGVLTIFQREVAFLLGSAHGDPRQARDLPALVGTTLRLVLLQMPVLLAGIAIVWLCLPASWAALDVPLGITLGCLLIAFPFRLYHALLMGLQDLRFLGVTAIVAWAVGAAVSATLVFRGWGLNALATSWCVSQFGTYAACYFRVRARFPSALEGGLPTLPRREAINRLRKGFWVIVSQVSVTLSSGVDLLVIAAVLGPAEVTPYAITDKLVTMLNNLPLMIMSSAQPALSELSLSSERGRLAEVCIALTRVVLVVSGLIAGVVIVVNQGFVTWWIGPGQFAGTTLLLLLVGDMLVGHWTSVTAYSLFSFGYERLISLVSILVAGVATVLTIILTKRLGLIGAPLASLAARAVFGLPVLLVAVARATGGTVKGLLLSVFSWAWRICLFAVGAVTLKRLWTPRSPIALVAAGLAAALVYTLITLPLLFREPLGAYMRPRLAALRRRLAPRA